MDTTSARLTVGTSVRSRALLLGGAAFVGFNLRATVLGVPPLLDRIGAGTGLGHAGQGLLTSLPVLLFGVFAIPGARIVRALGGRNTVVLGLALSIAGTLLRSAGFGVAGLFAGTALIGAGIGVAQPAVPRMVRAWMPERVQEASVFVTLGYISGQLIAAGGTLPFIAPLTGGGWRQTLFLWALPAIAALAWLSTQPADAAEGHEDGAPAAGRLLRSSQMWSVALLMAAANLTFFTANSWMAASAPGGANSAAAETDLALLNASALPVALLLAAWRRPFVRSRRFYLGGALASVAGAAGWLITPDLGPLWVVLIGAGGAFIFSGVVAFPATLRDTRAVAPFSAAVWTIGCVGAFAGPFLGGVGIDALHWTRAPFLAILVASAAMVACAAVLPRDDDTVF